MSIEDDLPDEPQPIDSDWAAERTRDMWKHLGEFFAKQLREGDAMHLHPKLAIQVACCAEACFWKATGEADAHDIKDVLALDFVELPAA